MCKQLYRLGYGGVGERSQLSPEVQNTTERFSRDWALIFDEDLLSHTRKENPYSPTSKCHHLRTKIHVRSVF